MEIVEERLVETAEPAVSALNQKYASRGVTFSFQIVNDPNRMSILVRFETLIREMVFPYSTPDNPFGRIHQSPRRLVDDFWVQLHPITGLPLAHPDVCLADLEGFINDLEQAFLSHTPAVPHSEPNRRPMQPCHTSRRRITSVIAHQFEHRAQNKRQCRFYGHTAEAPLRPCALHPGRKNGCEGCGDFDPHPLGEIFDFYETASVSVGQDHFAVCYSRPNLVGLAAVGLRRWKEQSPELSPRFVYFVGNRDDYQQAVSHLGVPYLPRFDCHAYSDLPIVLFYLKT